MKIYFRIIISACCLGTLANCHNLSHNQKQQDALRYYKEISAITTEATEPGANLTAYFQAVGPLAKADPNYQLSANKIDSFERLYVSFCSSTFRSKNKLKQLGEFDENWNMANLLIANYEIIQKGYDSTFPIYFNVYKTGWIKAPVSQRETIMNASQILNRTFALTKMKADSFEIEMMQFVKKYNIQY